MTHSRSIPAPVLALFNADRTGYRPRSGWRAAFGIALVLVVALATGEGADAGVVGLGALIGGLADVGGPKQKAFLVILASSALAGVGTLLGAVTANHDAIAIAVAAVWAFGAGLLGPYGRPGGIIGLTATLALIVAQGHWLNPGSASEHGGLVLLGGVTQALLLWVPGRLGEAERPSVPSLVLGSSTERHSLRLAFAIGCAVAVYRLLPFGEHGYWVAATVLFILRPGFDSILASAFARYVGSAVAVVVALLVASLLEPGQWVLVVLATASAAFCFSVFFYNFALFTVGASMVLIFLAALGGLPPVDSAVDFLIDASFGLVVAPLAYAVIPRHKAIEVEAGREPAAAT